MQALTFLVKIDKYFGTTLVVMLVSFVQLKVYNIITR